MRILALNCTEFAYTTDRPAIPNLVGDQRGPRRAYAKCLLLLVSVEPGDAAKVAGACKALRRLCRRTGASLLIVNGFAHLAEQLETPEISEAILRDIADRMTSETLRVELTPFGWHKRFEMSVRSDDHSQKFIHV